MPREFGTRRDHSTLLTSPSPSRLNPIPLSRDNVHKAYQFALGHVHISSHVHISGHVQGTAVTQGSGEHGMNNKNVQKRERPCGWWSYGCVRDLLNLLFGIDSNYTLPFQSRTLSAQTALTLAPSLFLTLPPPSPSPHEQRETMHKKYLS